MAAASGYKCKPASNFPAFAASRNDGISNCDTAGSKLGAKMAYVRVTADGVTRGKKSPEFSEGC